MPTSVLYALVKTLVINYDFLYMKVRTSQLHNLIKLRAFIEANNNEIFEITATCNFLVLVFNTCLLAIKKLLRVQVG